MSNEIATTAETALATTTDAPTNLAKVLLYTSWAKGDRPQQCADAGVDLNSFYLADDQGIIAKKPFKFFITPLFIELGVQTDSEGKVEKARLVTKDWRPTYDNGWKQNVRALVLVPMPYGLIAADFGATNAVCDVFKGRFGAIATAAKQSPEQYAQRGKQYEAAAMATLPFGRFTLSAWATEEPKPKKPKDKFVKGHSAIQPSTLDEVQAFNDFVASPDWKAACDAFMKRRQYLINLAAKTEAEVDA